MLKATFKLELILNKKYGLQRVFFRKFDWLDQ